MDKLTLVRINEFIRVWEPGLSAAELAKRVDKKTWGGLAAPTRQSIIGYHHRYKEKYLAGYPLSLTNPRKKSTKKAGVSEPVVKAPLSPPKKIGRPVGSVSRVPAADALPVASRRDPEFAARQERKFRLEQMLLDREPYWKEHQARLLRGGK